MALAQRLNILIVDCFIRSDHDARVRITDAIGVNPGGVRIFQYAARLGTKAAGRSMLPA